MYGELPEVKTEQGGSVRGFPVLIEASPTGPKTALLRLPTPEEEIKYFSAQCTVYRDLGRGMGEWEAVPTPKADLSLFRSLRLDNLTQSSNGRAPSGDAPVEFDEAEAKYAISLILKNAILSCERDGDAYIVELATLFGTTTHTLRLPYHSERLEYANGYIKSRDMPHSITERRTPIEVPVKLYDKIVRASEGYGVSFPVPPHHKREVVFAVMSSLASSAPDLDPNF